MAEAPAFARLIDNVERVVLGKRAVVETVVAALRARGRVLQEDVPGVVLIYLDLESHRPRELAVCLARIHPCANDCSAEMRRALRVSITATVGFTRETLLTPA